MALITKTSRLYRAIRGAVDKAFAPGRLRGAALERCAAEGPQIRLIY